MRQINSRQSISRNSNRTSSPTSLTRDDWSLQHQMVLSNYHPGDRPPTFKLTSDSEAEQVTFWCETFKTYIKAGKIRQSLNIPYSMVVGYVAKHADPDFFDTTLRVFINQNCPEEDPLDNRMSEDIIVELIYHYYSSTTLLHSRITSLRRYRHQKNETFDQFSARAERLIGAANFPSMTCDQMAILFHTDMLTNRYLKEEVHRKFDWLFDLSYDEALHEISESIIN